MVYGETYLGDGGGWATNAQEAAWEEAAELTERVATAIRTPDRLREGGWEALCGKVIALGLVDLHAERCAECREVADA